MTLQYDEDGQPPRGVYFHRVQRRLVSELLGLCKGMICDGVVSNGEAHALRRWLQGHPDVTVQYPGNVLAERLIRSFQDGHIDGDERQELYDLMLDLTGETEEHDQPLNLSSRHPFDDPLPTVLFDNQEYVFTGRMIYASRKECEQMVIDRGARVHGTVTKQTDFVVVGPMASAAWLESTHGRKLLRAVELRSQGVPVHVIPEEYWIKAIHEE